MELYLHNKEIYVNCEDNHFSIMQKRENWQKRKMMISCNHNEADTRMLFHVGHLAVSNNGIFRIGDTGILIKAPANIKKLSAGMNV